jgi:biopolymer transport protein ExbB
MSSFPLISVPADSTATQGVGTQSIMDLVFSGGISSVLILGILLVLSFIGIIIFVERWLTIKKAGKIDENFMNNIRANVQNGNLQGAKQLCQQTDSPVARMIEKGLNRIGKPLRDIDAAIENVGNVELLKLEKNLPFLASISGISPMVGLLGTVSGMILAFYSMATAQNVTPDVLAGGIYQALFATAFGLFNGIFSLLGYNLLVANIDKVVYKMQLYSMEFMDLLQEPSK